jgi:hypothetical protein
MSYFKLGGLPGHLLKKQLIIEVDSLPPPGDQEIISNFYDAIWNFGFLQEYHYINIKLSHGN